MTRVRFDTKIESKIGEELFTLDTASIVEYYEDSNHVGDTDGNRGSRKIYVDDIKIMKVRLSGREVTPDDDLELGFKSLIEEKFINSMHK